MNQISSDLFYMNKALDVASLAIPRKIAPNPFVGAVLVREGQILGEGFHECYGEDHAEVVAIKEAKLRGFGDLIAGSTLYSTLEPCSHEKKQTPPCVKLLLENKIGRVVIASIDPNPLVKGKGVEILEREGIQCTLLNDKEIERRSEELNIAFFTVMRKNRPYIHLKWAQSLDGKLSAGSGDSKWISNEQSRKHAHELRSKMGGVLVGTRTIILDNPKLNVRYQIEDSFSELGVPPLKRIVLGQGKDLTFREEIFQDALAREKKNTIVITFSPNKFHSIPSWVHLEELPSSLYGKDEELVSEICQRLLKLKVTSLLVEGGTNILSTFLRSKQFDKVTIYTAPLLLGGKYNSSFDLKILKVKEGIKFQSFKQFTLEDNFVFEGVL